MHTRYMYIIHTVYNFSADNMAVRELLSVANFFHAALEQARKGEDTNESSVFYGLNSQVYCKHKLFVI